MNYSMYQIHISYRSSVYFKKLEYYLWNVFSSSFFSFSLAVLTQMRTIHDFFLVEKQQCLYQILTRLPNFSLLHGFIFLLISKLYNNQSNNHYYFFLSVIYFIAANATVGLWWRTMNNDLLKTKYCFNFLASINMFVYLSMCFNIFVVLCVKTKLLKLTHPQLFVYLLPAPIRTFCKHSKVIFLYSMIYEFLQDKNTC